MVENFHYDESPKYERCANLLVLQSAKEKVDFVKLQRQSRLISRRLPMSIDCINSFCGHIEIVDPYRIKLYFI